MKKKLIVINIWLRFFKNTPADPLPLMEIMTNFESISKICKIQEFHDAFGRKLKYQRISRHIRQEIELSKNFAHVEVI